MYIKQLDDWGKPIYFVYLHNKNTFIGTLEEALEEVNAELKKTVTRSYKSLELALALEQDEHEKTKKRLDQVAKERNDLDTHVQSLNNLVLALKDDRITKADISRLLNHGLTTTIKSRSRESQN